MKNRKLYIGALIGFVAGCVVSSFATAHFIFSFIEFTTTESIAAEAIVIVNTLELVRENKIKKSIKIQEATLYSNVVAIMSGEKEKLKNINLIKKAHSSISMYRKNYPDSFQEVELRTKIDGFINEYGKN